MIYSDAFRRCLDELDIEGVRVLWAHIEPNMPQPMSDHEALVTLHRARTEARSISLDKRAYSHRWLLDHGYPSGLPDILKPRAERIYPKIVGGVGIASLSIKPHTLIVRGAMQDAVLECYEDKRTEPGFVKSRMLEVRAYTLKKLFG